MLKIWKLDATTYWWKTFLMKNNSECSFSKQIVLITCEIRKKKQTHNPTRKENRKTLNNPRVDELKAWKALEMIEAKEFRWMRKNSFAANIQTVVLVL